MADREEKLAAARKKLKQFQQRKNTPTNSPSGTKAKKTKKDKSSSLRHDNNDPQQPWNSSSLGASPNSSSFFSPSNSPQRPMSSVESLRQINMQLNGIVSEASFLENNGTSPSTLDNRTSLDLDELKARNQELAALAEKHGRTNEQLNLKLEDMKLQFQKKQEEFEKVKGEMDNQSLRELGSVKEQLQVHIQTIGILVSEKSELQSALNLSNSSLKQKSEDVENLGSRLQASRQRLAELERQLASASNSSSQYEKTSKELDKERDNLKMDVYNLRKANEELVQQNSELSSHLNSTVSHYGQMESKAQNLQERLSMSELLVQQLSGQESAPETKRSLQLMQQEKKELEAKLQQYDQALRQVSADREQVSQQYQQQVLQFQQQSQQQVAQINGLNSDNEQLAETNKQMQLQIDKLEKQAQEKGQNGNVHDEIMNVVSGELEELRAAKLALETQLQGQVSDNAQLSLFNREQEVKLEGLERRLEGYERESADRGHLLEEAQSHKATISRAVSQNKQLKEQLAELQNAFIKMSNDNMELATKNTSEQHISGELANRLAQQELELKEARDELSKSESELDKMSQQCYELNKQLMQQSQLADRMQHYEAQGQLTNAVQRELQSAQERVNGLSSQNSELRGLVAELETRLSMSAGQEDPMESTADENGVMTSRYDMVDHMSASIRQLEMEREQLTQQFLEQKQQHQQLYQQLEMLRQEQSQAPAVLPDDDHFVSRETFEALQTAMEQLQQKFMRVMADKANLSDACQQLEHANLQLSAEVETIGEYISLYHSQREMLKQRQRINQEYLVQLTQERENLQGRLGHLQGLVMQLLRERQALHPYTITPVVGQDQSSLATSKMVNVPDSFGKSLDSSTLGYEEDWPSSSDSDTESTDVPLSSTPKKHKAAASSPSRHALPTANETAEARTKNVDGTAKQIIQLLEKMGGSDSLHRADLLDRDFWPCRYCVGDLKVV